MSLRAMVGHKAPYWVWRFFAMGMKGDMRQNQPIRNLALMVNAPDELLDRKGLYVKRCAAEILDEHINGRSL